VNEALASANIVSLVLAHTPRQENCLSNSAQIFFLHLKKDLDIVKRDIEEHTRRRYCYH
jgi:hypothetical protein